MPVALPGDQPTVSIRNGKAIKNKQVCIQLHTYADNVALPGAAVSNRSV